MFWHVFEAPFKDLEAGWASCVPKDDYSFWMQRNASSDVLSAEHVQQHAGSGTYTHVAPWSPRLLLGSGFRHDAQQHRNGLSSVFLFAHGVMYL